MNYTLMHKKEKVISLKYNENAIAFTDIVKIHNPKFYPLGVMRSDKELFTEDSFDIQLLNAWWSKRCIPGTRENIEEKIRGFKLKSTKEFLIKSLGLTLTDQYWIKPDDYTKTWSETNLFDNDFDEEIGKLLFETTPSYDSYLGQSISPSPDAGTDGMDPKKWIINKQTKERILIKGDSRETFFIQYEPTNEMLAAEIYKRIGLPYATYSIVKHNESYLSASPCFITTRTEMFSADKIIRCFPLPDSGKNPFDHLIDCCEKLHIPNAKQDLVKLFAVDFLLAQEDRHYGNFAFLRDADSLSWKGLAPIYDSGKCMRMGLADADFDKSEFLLSKNIKARPFADNHAAQIKLIPIQESNFDFSKLEGIETFYDEIMQYNKKISSERRNLLCTLLKNRIKELREISCK